MTQREELMSLFQQARSVPLANSVQLKDQLSHEEMLDLADLFEGWAIYQKTSPHQSAELVGWAEALRDLAESVGEHWGPEVSKPLPLLTFIARLMRQ